MAAPSMRQVEGRKIRVHLPPGYDAGRADPYPVLVLHDGQNLFASEPEAWGGSWRADETIDALVDAGTIPPVVLVGVDHLGPGRIEEFAPATGRRAAGSRVAAYAALVFDRVLPALGDELHLRTDAEGVAIGGASMGGLVTLWMAAMRPERCARLMVMSPSVWYGRRAILKLLRRRPVAPGARVWVDAGVREGERVYRDARSLVDVLRAQGTEVTHYVEDAVGDHSESAWARRLPDALRFLFS
ncbi:MAG: alpha/beta hydrolase-fold protein [Vicinamibacterales bacterium]